MWYSFYYIVYYDEPHAECFSLCETREEAIKNLVDKYHENLKPIYIDELWEEAHNELCEDDTIKVVVAGI